MASRQPTRRGTPRGSGSRPTGGGRASAPFSRPSSGRPSRPRGGRVSQPKVSTVPSTARLRSPKREVPVRKPAKPSLPSIPLPRPGRGEQTPAERRSARRDKEGNAARRLIVACIAVAIALLVALVGFLVLSYTPVFSITSIETTATEHVSKDDIAKLAAIPQGTTLLNLDEAKITSNLQKNPWVGQVTYVREFPNTLRIEVTERSVESLVVMSSGSVVWCLGDGGVWIEPVSVTTSDGESIDDAALAKAQEMGALLITDVPATVSPVAGSTASDSVIQAVETYQSTFSDTLTSQIVSYSAQSLDSISCTLKSGVEISLGSATDVSTKEEVIEQILSQYSGKLTYINVRVPSKPTYRMIDSDNVGEGTGALVGTATSSTDASDSSATDSAATASSAAADSSADSTAVTGQ